ncbi:RNA polymerase sigma factor [Kineosporia sp. NBRC 101677]|uniref:RNA polymerase sigma factor n=1 Tax=Kineosporia sp. NBRC 101677 TaxID=3032197 RepID=UPI002557BB93|nr:RNA polymerase sigma factor [Kineosporia sp. NBRC 101677]
MNTKSVPRGTVASDADLIAGCLAGDEDAFVRMVSRHEEAISRYLVRQVGREAAQDLLGEVWIEAYTSRASYDRSYADARPWLYGVALNQVRRLWRNRPPENLIPDMGELPIAWDPWPTVEIRLDAREALRGALAALRPDARDVLTLVVGEDLAVVDAARVLGITAAKARRLLYEARASLRQDSRIAALLDELNNVGESK